MVLARGSGLSDVAAIVGIPESSFAYERTPETDPNDGDGGYGPAKYGIQYETDRWRFITSADCYTAKYEDKSNDFGRTVLYYPRESTLAH